VPVAAGEVVRARDVVGRSLLAALGPDVVATPVRLSDDAGLAGVRAGDIVDVVAARGGEGEGTGAATASVVASRVRVLTVGATSASGGGLLGGTGSTSAPVLLLATTSAQALEIAAAVVVSRLSVTLRSA
jgi:pilus assembly protein CpaB